MFLQAKVFQAAYIYLLAPEKFNLMDGIGACAERERRRHGSAGISKIAAGAPFQVVKGTSVAPMA